MLFSPSRSLKVPKPFLPNPKAPKLPNAQLTQNQKHEQLDSSSFTGLRKLRSSYLTGRALSLSLLPPSFLSPGLGCLSLSLNLCLYKNMYTHIYIHTHTYLSRESCSKDSSAFHDLSNCQLNGLAPRQISMPQYVASHGYQCHETSFVASSLVLPNWLM